MIGLSQKGIYMPKMTKYQLEHFEDKVKRNLDPLIEEQELLVKQFTTEATDKASKKLAIKIGAQKIIDALQDAEENLTRRRLQLKVSLRRKQSIKT